MIVIFGYRYFLGKVVDVLVLVKFVRSFFNFVLVEVRLVGRGEINRILRKEFREEGRWFV